MASDRAERAAARSARGVFSGTSQEAEGATFTPRGGEPVNDRPVTMTEMMQGFLQMQQAQADAI